MATTSGDDQSKSQQQQPMTRLIAHFKDRPDDQSQGSGWDDLWTSDQSDLWDRGITSPPLTEFLAEHKDKLLPLKHDDGQPLKALVPGCGKGYEVILLARHGFEAYGLEVSETAVQVAERHADSVLQHKFSSTLRSSDGNLRAAVNFIHGDFFNRDWEVKCGITEARRFDLIYDYTFLCALPPQLRRSWAQRMEQLLNPGGILVCLEFPLYKKLSWLGPPWGLKGVHWNLLAQGQDGILHDDSPAADAEENNPDTDNEGPFKRVMYMKPRETYEVSKGTDMLSIWTRRDNS